MSAPPEDTAVPAARRALLLANPKARNGASNAVDAARETLETGGIAVTVELPEHVEDLRRHILAHRGDVDCVVLAGGDGTLNAGVSAIQRIRVPFGIIPLGTGNDLARTLGLPESATAAAQIIVEGYHRAIDVGTVNGRPFFNVASMGLSASLAERLDTTMKRRWGRLAYALTGMRVLLEARPFRAEIIDPCGRRQVKTLQIAVGNGRHYGGGNVVEETAAIDDGHLDLYSLELGNVLKLALMLRSFRSGRHGLWSEVRTDRRKSFEVHAEPPQAINADGDLIARTPARFKVHPAAVRVYTPRSPAETAREPV